MRKIQFRTKRASWSAWLTWKSIRIIWKEVFGVADLGNKPRQRSFDVSMLGRRFLAHDFVLGDWRAICLHAACAPYVVKIDATETDSDRPEFHGSSFLVAYVKRMSLTRYEEIGGVHEDGSNFQTILTCRDCLDSGVLPTCVQQVVRVVLMEFGECNAKRTSWTGKSLASGCCEETAPIKFRL